MSDDQPLTLKYRPRRFEDVAGQNVPRLVLQRMLERQQIRPVLLFWGHMAVGKTSMARILAAALNCEKGDIVSRPCGQCDSCEAVVAGRSVDVTEVDAASSGLVNDVRELRSSLQFAPQSRYRVCVLDEVHELTARGFQTLLKTLEEPPERTVFVLVTTERNSVPETIQSRCLSLEFRRLTVSQLTGRLRQVASAEGLEASDELLAAIAARSDGAARDAVGLLDQVRLVGVQTPEQLIRMLGEVDHGSAILAALAPDFAGTVDYSAAFEAVSVALSGSPRAAVVVSAVVSSLRALLAAQGSGEPLPPELAALAQRISPARAAAALRVIWDYHVRVGSVAEAQAGMDLLVVRLGEALSGTKVPGGSVRSQ